MSKTIKSLLAEKTLEELLTENLEDIKNLKESIDESEPDTYASNSWFETYLSEKYNKYIEPFFKDIQTTSLIPDKQFKNTDIFKFLVEVEFKGQKTYLQIKNEVTNHEFFNDLNMSVYRNYFSMGYLVTGNRAKERLIINNDLMHLFKLKNNIGPRISKILKTDYKTKDIDWSKNFKSTYSSLLILNALIAIQEEDSFITFLEPDKYTNRSVTFNETFKVNLLMAWRELHEVGKITYIETDPSVDDTHIIEIKIQRTIPYGKMFLYKE